MEIVIHGNSRSLQHKYIKVMCAQRSILTTLMSTYTNIANTFSNIANAIRIRTHSTDTYTPEQMPAAINAITSVPDDYCIIVDGVKRVGKGQAPLTQESYGPITIGNNVQSCEYLFFRCANFNQPVTIPEGVINCYYMFTYCTNFNQPIYVPSTVTNVDWMFSFCTNMNSTVYLPNSLNNGATTRFWDRCPVTVANGTLIFY